MGSVFLRGNSWVGEFRVNGKVKRKAIGRKGIVTKTMAKEVLKQWEQQVKLGQLDLLEAKIPVLNDFAKEYIVHLRDIKRKSSWDRAELALRHFSELYGNRRLSEITVSDIDDYKQNRISKVKEGTVDRELVVIRAMFNQARKWNKVFGDNPVSKAGLINANDQKERILTREEEQSLLNNSNASLRAIITCALNTAMRKGEIISLKWENLDLTNNVITLEHTNTKSKKIRRIPINATLRDLFIELKLKSGGSKFVFNYLNSKGEPNPYLRHDSLNRAFGEACKGANIIGLRFHDLRHTAATRMVESGANIVAVSKILGHADLKTTMRYAHPEDSLKDAVESLTRGFSPSVADEIIDSNQIEK